MTKGVANRDAARVGTPLVTATGVQRIESFRARQHLDPPFPDAHTMG
jgi:3-keto-L-gulonate-6-phosphate decarboxylase